MARRPGRLAVAGLLVCLLGATGFARFSVDAGAGLLAGGGSDARQTYDRFTAAFGTDPIVVVLRAPAARTFSDETNLVRLGLLEQDLSTDPSVASVLGPGTVAQQVARSAKLEVDQLGTQYGVFVGELAVADAIQKAQAAGKPAPSSDELTSTLTTFTRAGEAELLSRAVKAVQAADGRRADYRRTHTGAAYSLRDQELAAEQGVADEVAHDGLPQFFSAYLAAPSAKPDEAVATRNWVRLTAAIGQCSDTLSQVMGANQSCQGFFEHVLLDLPACASLSSAGWCAPKPQWGAVLPRPGNGADAHAVITVRLRPGAVDHPDRVREVESRLTRLLDRGDPSSGNQLTRSLGAFAPVSCTGAPDQPCRPQGAAQTRVAYTVAGAPLLGAGVVDAVTHLLAVLFPLALVLMLLLVLGLFRVRGRLWPLLSAGAAALLTVGLTLLVGAPLTPAVLAGVPVLAGLAVDYAVQLVARFAEERGRGLGVEAALRATLAGTGPATLVAAAATLVGVAVLALVAGVDGGPLVAVPLVAQFALVLGAGVIVSWIAALVVALPAAAWGELRRERRGPAAHEAAPAAQPAAPRVALLAARWPLVLVPGALLALAGWAVTPRVPVQTGGEQLLGTALREYGAITTVRGEIGFGNEIDLFVEGPVLGGDSIQNVPENILYQGALAADLRACRLSSEVAQATSVADLLIGNNALAGASTTRCQTTPSPGAVPGATPSPGATGSPPPAGATPSAGTSPRSSRGGAAAPDAVRVASDGGPVAATTPGASPPASSTPAAPSPGASPGVTATPAPSAGTAPANTVAQSADVCQLRLFPVLASGLVNGFTRTTPPCPDVDVLRQTPLATDSGPVRATASRVALGVRPTSVADQAALVDDLRTETAHAPQGVTVTPTGLAVLAVHAYDALRDRALLFNLVPLVAVALALLAVYRRPRRALLPVLPTALAAGWAPLVVLLLGRLPGAGGTLGSLNPLTAVLGAVVVALGTEFGVVLLQRFHEELAAGLDPEAAAATAVARVGRPILVSAGTLGIGFGVLAVSGLFPGGLPMVADFGLEVVVDLGLAVLAVFAVMLPVAVALERAAPSPLAAAPDAAGAQLVFRRLEPAAPAAAPAAPSTPTTPSLGAAPTAPSPPRPPAEAAPAGPPRRIPGVSGRPRAPEPPPPPPQATPGRTPRVPGVSGRPRRAAPQAAQPSDAPPTAGAAPPAGATPPAEAAPSAGARPPAGAAPPAGAGSAGVAPPPEPPESAPRRRRRPPPSVRRRQVPPEE